MKYVLLPSLLSLLLMFFFFLKRVSIVLTNFNFILFLACHICTTLSKTRPTTSLNVSVSIDIVDIAASSDLLTEQISPGGEVRAPPSKTNRNPSRSVVVLAVVMVESQGLGPGRGRPEKRTSLGLRGI